MFKLIIRIVINSVSIWVASLILDKVTLEGSVLQVLIVGLVFGIINALIKPLLKLISFPIIILTLGLFTVIINAFLLWLVDLLSGSVFIVDGALTYLWASIIIRACESLT
jgi:putative membrane protein